LHRVPRMALFIHPSYSSSRFRILDGRASKPVKMASDGYSTIKRGALIPGPGESFLRVLLIGRRDLRRAEFDCQLDEFAGEAERWLIVLVVHTEASIHADVEAFVDRQDGRDG